MISYNNFDDGADLTLYYKGQQFDIGLSPLQLQTVIKVLGLSFIPPQDVLSFSDETLKKLWEMKGNPLKLKEI